jgi:cellulose synthase/poly-beta-1,6-N-acetylglucosamine synthase-like glycosyltransferase
MSALYLVCQILYFFSFVIALYFLTRNINWVNMADVKQIPKDKYPKIILLYPVLKELEETMRTTFLGLAKMDYPKDKFRIIAIPNWDDVRTIESLKRLVHEFPFLEILTVPLTTDPSWQIVWDAWDKNPKAYWWHKGKYQQEQTLPPKKTRQMLYAFYTLVSQVGDDWLLDYIDADSVPPTDHFLAAAAGISEGYDVLQSTNIAGNLLDTWAASFHSMDHMVWDGFVYPHMSADGKHPFWVLGKGLFYKARDLVEVGCFNPWVTIEDPEIGMRLWTNGKRIGMIANPLIEEVPLTIKRGAIQRYRWVCGFFQSLNGCVQKMGMNFWQRQQARLNLIPTLFLLINVVGLPTGVWALIQWLEGTSPLPFYWVILSIVNIAAYLILMTVVYVNTWRRTAIVCKKRSSRVAYMFRVNPIFLWVYWLIWCIPIIIGFGMFLLDKGKVWQRTDKLDRNHRLVRGNSDK